MSGAPGPTLFGPDFRRILADVNHPPVEGEEQLLESLIRLVGPHAGRAALVRHLRVCRGRLYWAVNSYFREVAAVPAPNGGRADYAPGPLLLHPLPVQEPPAAAHVQSCPAHHGCLCGLPCGCWKDGLLALPRAALEEVLSHAGVKAVCSAASVCRDFRDAASSGLVWKRLYEQRWGEVPDLPPAGQCASPSISQALTDTSPASPGQNPATSPPARAALLWDALSCPSTSLEAVRTSPMEIVADKRPILSAQYGPCSSPTEIVKDIQHRQTDGNAPSSSRSWPCTIHASTREQQARIHGNATTSSAARTAALAQQGPLAFPQEQGSSEGTISPVAWQAGCHLLASSGCGPSVDSGVTQSTPDCAGAGNGRKTDDAARKATGGQKQVRAPLPCQTSDGTGGETSGMGNGIAEGNLSDNMPRVGPPSSSDVLWCGGHGARSGAEGGGGAGRGLGARGVFGKGASWREAYIERHMAEQRLQCPECSPGRIAPVLYGYPSDELIAGMRSFRLMLGGDYIMPALPLWGCPWCHAKFEEYPYAPYEA